MSKSRQYPPIDQLVGFDVSSEVFQNWLEFGEILRAAERVSVQGTNRPMHVRSGCVEAVRKLLKINDDKCNIVRLTGL